MTATSAEQQPAVATLFPGYFALVMATGIVAVGSFQQDLVGRAVIRCYREKFRGRPKERPLLGDFRACLQEVAADPSAADHDRATAAELCLRLRMFCDEDGLYSKFLNRPSQLRFDGRLLTFELERVSKL